jgi:spermidine synthase
MKPWRTLGRSNAASGGVLTLNERDGEFSIRIDAWELMSSRKHGSEDAMAEVGCRHILTKQDASVLVAGLGLGYSLRATLDVLPKTAKVTVAEFVPEIVEWNRGPVAHLADRPLEDPRVELVVGDVKDVMKKRSHGFDAILLDTDNGPRAFTDLSNEALYAPAGLRIAKQALRKNGVLVIWSAGPDVKFEKRMRDCGFQAESVIAAAQGNGKGAKHVLFVGTAR